jgi:hypothetical protein
MSEGIGLATGREFRTLIGLPLLLYVLLRGLDATVLKWLQRNGPVHAVNGENPISFCNVFFAAQAIVGLSALLTGRCGLRRHLGVDFDPGGGRQRCPRADADRGVPVWGERQRRGPIRSATWAVQPLKHLSDRLPPRCGFVPALLRTT